MRDESGRAQPGPVRPVLPEPATYGIQALGTHGDDGVCLLKHLLTHLMQDPWPCPCHIVHGWEGFHDNDGDGCRPLCHSIFFGEGASVFSL